ncbi:MAG: DsrE family protein [Sulfuritalea sp.]|nr:DsrE family protein [Sulfuritalea sp.]MDP1984180.1 DsrE family protein [Sulfuritalea sp.]
MNDSGSRHLKKLAILVWSATPDRPQLCATPFVHAAAAAAFDCEVEIHFAGPAVRLLVAGVAESLRPWPGVDTSIYHMMRQAANLDVSFRACAMAMGELVGKDEALIPEYAGPIAASVFVDRTLDPEWATLVY